jgi:hypothetical protein
MVVSYHPAVSVSGEIDLDTCLIELVLDILVELE